jgi:citrate lyase subunit beta/citryl-CoA lyase
MRRLRSLLFVPGDRPDRMAKALDSGADALILDLEDAVSLDRKSIARLAVAEFLTTATRQAALVVRVNPLDSDLNGDDLAAILPRHPDAIVLPKAGGAESVRRLLTRMPTPCPILPIATETPGAIFDLGTYRAVANCLAGLTWGAEDLPAAVGASTSHEPDGRFRPPYELARSLTLFGAHAAGIAAIETVYPVFRDLDGLKAYAERAQADGFMGMMAIHPTQSPVINAAFTPSDDAIRNAKTVLDAFAANPGAGALQLDGKMIDAPHLKQARAILQRAGQFGEVCDGQ